MTTLNEPTATVGDLLRSRLTIVWAILVAATLMSFWLGSDGEVSWFSGTIAIIAVTMIKVYLIGMYFMELGNAPALLRAIFQAYCIVTFLVLVGVYVLV